MQAGLHASSMRNSTTIRASHPSRPHSCRLADSNFQRIKTAWHSTHNTKRARLRIMQLTCSTPSQPWCFLSLASSPLLAYEWDRLFVWPTHSHLLFLYLYLASSKYSHRSTLAQLDSLKRLQLTGPLDWQIQLSRHLAWTAATATPSGFRILVSPLFELKCWVGSIIQWRPNSVGSLLEFGSEPVQGSKLEIEVN